MTLTIEQFCPSLAAAIRDALGNRRPPSSLAVGPEIQRISSPAFSGHPLKPPLNQLRSKFVADVAGWRGEAGVAWLVRLGSLY